MSGTSHLLTVLINECHLVVKNCPCNQLHCETCTVILINKSTKTSMNSTKHAIRGVTPLWLLTQDSNNLLILFNIYSIKNCIIKSYLMFYSINFIHFCKYMLILNLSASSTLETSCDRGNKDWERTVECYTGSTVTGDSVIIGYEGSVLERLRCS